MKSTESFSGRSPETIEYGLNRMVSFEIKDRENIAIHVASTREGSWRKKLELFKSGLSELAALLKGSDMFRDIRRITATSWIVSEHPRVLERLGFQVDYEGADLFGLESKKHYTKMEKTRKLDISLGKHFVKPGFATMSKEEFLNRYGA